MQIMKTMKRRKNKYYIKLTLIHTSYLCVVHIFHNVCNSTLIDCSIELNGATSKGLFSMVKMKPIVKFLKTLQGKLT